MELIDFFTKDLKPRQKQYEAIRAVAFREGNLEGIATRFGYTLQSLRTLISRLLSGKHELFPKVKRGPKGRHTSPEIVELIVQLRREKRLNSTEITEELNQAHIPITVRTVERILSEVGFPKLRRRTNRERDQQRGNAYTEKIHQSGSKKAGAVSGRMPGGWCLFLSALYIGNRHPRYRTTICSARV